MKAHNEINKLIASANLQSYQEGGEVKETPPLRGTKKRFREKAANFLSMLTEKHPLLDKLYYSPEESYGDAIGSNLVSFGLRPGSPHLDSEKRGKLSQVSAEGLKELWRQSGSPFVRTHGERHAAYIPAGAEWHYAKKTPKTLMDKLFNLDTVYIPEQPWGGGSSDMAVSEFAHGLRFTDPQKYSKYKSRKGLLLGKGEEHAEDELYHTPGTDEYQTHSVVEPQIRDWLIKNYGFNWDDYNP